MALYLPWRSYLRWCPIPDAQRPPTFSWSVSCGVPAAGCPLRHHSSSNILHLMQMTAICKSRYEINNNKKYSYVFPKDSLIVREAVTFLVHFKQADLYISNLFTLLITKIVVNCFDSSTCGVGSCNIQQSKLNERCPITNIIATGGKYRVTDFFALNLWYFRRSTHRYHDSWQLFSWRMINYILCEDQPQLLYMVH